MWPRAWMGGIGRYRHIDESTDIDMMERVEPEQSGVPIDSFPRTKGIVYDGSGSSLRADRNPLLKSP